MRAYHHVDQLLAHIDRSLKTVTGTLPAAGGFNYENNNDSLTQAEQSKSEQLMRINHCGEVCAQGLYHGQILSARNESTKAH